MKVGVLTFHFGYNYGGILQAYAMQRYLSSLNYQVEIINYIPRGYNNPQIWFGVSPRKPFQALISIVIKLLYQKKSIQSFKSFREDKFVLSTEINSENDIAGIANNYDAIIVGSDQVWGPSHHDKHVYFLDWNPPYRGRKISYSPCCSVNNVNERNLHKLKDALDDFLSISVRNETTFDFVKAITGKEYPIVLDPTLLWNYDEFDLRKSIIKGKYILTYILSNEISGTNAGAIRRIKELYGDIPVYAVDIAALKPRYCSWSDKTLYTVSPTEWLNLIANATYFFTDSFHGVIFALKYRTRFLAYYSEEKRASRFIHLQKHYNLNDLIIVDCKQIKFISDNDYNNIFDSVDVILENELKSSKEFLLNALNCKI